jgi:ribonuclease HI
MEAFPISSNGGGYTNNNNNNINEDSLPVFTKTKLRKMKVDALRTALSRRGMSAVGKRDILVTRLLATRDDNIDNSVDTDMESNDTATATTPTLDPTVAYRLRVKGHTTQNSSGAGIGLVLLDDNNNDNNNNNNNENDEGVLWQGRIYASGNRTSFEAEHSAVIVGIQYATQILGARKLIIQLSHDAIVYQLNGVYDINKPSLKLMLELTKDTKEALDECTFEEITATENELANGLSTKALATRKSVNIVTEFDLQDPIDVLKESMENVSRWNDTDDPAHHEVIDPSRDYLMRFDGGSRGNPGVAAAGMVIYDDKGQEVWCGWKYYDEPATNNVAEYLGLVYGLKVSTSFGIKKLIVEGDSQLIVRHVTGQYKCRDETLKVFLETAKEQITELEYFEIRHIPRAENSRADWLANHAMDLRESHGFDEIE